MGLLERLVVGSAPWLPRFVIGRVAARYVAGDSLEDGLALAKHLNTLGFAGTLDVLGEEVRAPEATLRFRDAYLEALDGIANRGADCNVSLKLTALGLRIDPELCWDNLAAILDRAREFDNFVRFDMEDSSITQATLEMCHRACEYYPRCGTVLQASLRRTLEDARGLAGAGSNVRICKGAYIEPEAIAFQEFQEVRDSFMAVARQLLEQGTYACFATHDLWLIERCEALVTELGVAPDRYEFQALSGVPVEPTLDQLLASGHRVRYYIPFGPEWYAYSLRRMRENPAIWRHTLRAMFSRSHHRRR
ncbi:MAG: proline dehydrogenase family protein [Candidatus Poseidoniia archaeon]|jgi:proline dehydrogenase|nr:proline dehydrogenase [Euryarchaeota archaeon]MDP6275034.1 proline dehydrogenase family protein [Candidatus Poseidoniia archaeon]MDP7136117.1 proline dehydrogenase family protein [Candidatus Poseidoniia archaeon]MDP7243333.1 proline dehydrogenase family protein [Candidatus Poseidoniia archaeon]MDP7535735.1 proline dehydrogenase family protein [Candidatus Poseidoniia archaeon]|tara:strand:- start:10 stop:927 length:918 start_codon:yes stop_codon:yes gene_type:complete